MREWRLECDGRRGFKIGLGHRQPINYPYELRYGRDEAKRKAVPAPVLGTITTPWRVVMMGPDLNALVNCDVLPNLCEPPDPKVVPPGHEHALGSAGDLRVEVRRWRRAEHDREHEAIL